MLGNRALDAGRFCVVRTFLSRAAFAALVLAAALASSCSRSSARFDPAEDAELDGQGFTRLWRATGRYSDRPRDLDAIEAAIARGADFEREYDGETPLMYAAASGDEALFELLLRHGADIDRRSSRGHSPLRCAIHGGHAKLARRALELGARAKDDEERTHMLHECVEHDDPTLVDLVLDLGATIDAREGDDGSIDGATALHIACDRSRRAAAMALLAHGASIDARTARGWTPLHLAAAREDARLVELLIERGASLSASDAAGITPLHFAAAFGSNRALQSIAAGSWRDRTIWRIADAHGWLPVHWAAFHGRAEIVRDALPVELDDVGRPKDLGLFTRWMHRTPLHLAALRCEGPTVEALSWRLAPQALDAVDASGASARELLRRRSSALAKLTSDPVARSTSSIATLPEWDGSPPWLAWRFHGGFSSARGGLVLAIWRDGVVVRSNVLGSGDDDPPTRWTTALLAPGEVASAISAVRESGACDAADVFRVCVDCASDSWCIELDGVAANMQVSAVTLACSGQDDLDARLLARTLFLLEDAVSIARDAPGTDLDPAATGSVRGATFRGCDLGAPWCEAPR